MDRAANPPGPTTQVMAEAQQIVAEAVARSTVLAMLAADVGGCHGCRAEAASTVAWALSMAEAAAPRPSANTEVLERWLYPDEARLSGIPHQ